MKFFNSNIKHYTFPFATAFCIALSGCGGDDSGTAATSNSGDTLTAVVISESNMTDVAAGVIMGTSANRLSTTGPSTSGTGLVMGVETTSNPAPTDTLMKLAVEQAKAANSKLGAQGVVVGVQSSETFDCSSGSVTYSYDLQSTSGTFAAGDRISVSFSACQEGDMLMNGGMQMTINSFNGFTDPTNPVGSMNISAIFTNLSIKAAQTELTTNGGMNIAATITDTVASITVQASSISYALENNGNRMSMTLANLIEKADDYADRFELTVSEHFSASFPTFSGSGDVTTVSPVVNYWASGITGKLKVTGDNSVLYITLQGADSVYLELDRDNNGTIDASATKTLSELDPTIGLI
jgi:hypothetical protein